MKYVRKWRLLKRNRIIGPEAAVNDQLCLENRFFLNCLKRNQIFSKLCLGKLKFLKILPGKIEIYLKCAWKNRNFLRNCLRKIEISRIFSWKIEILLTRIHDPPDFKPDWRRCPTGALPLDLAGGLPVLIRLLYVHPLVQFLNTPLHEAVFAEDKNSLTTKRYGERRIPMVSSGAQPPTQFWAFDAKT